MESEENRKFDELTKKLIGDFSEESPSMNFTNLVMDEVEALSKSSIFEYKPLISKKVWLVFTVFIAAVFGYLIFGDVQTETIWASKISDLAPVLNSFSPAHYTIPDIFLYGVVGFTFFMVIQVLMLKNHFDQRLV